MRRSIDSRRGRAAPRTTCFIIKIDIILFLFINLLSDKLLIRLILYDFGLTAKWLSSFLRFLKIYGHFLKKSEVLP